MSWWKLPLQKTPVRLPAELMASSLPRVPRDHNPLYVAHATAEMAELAKVWQESVGEQALIVSSKGCYIHILVSFMLVL